MENVGKLVSRYYIKTSGFFSKNKLLLNIHEKGLVFTNPSSAKYSKEIEICYIADLSEISLSDRNDKDVNIKLGKQIYTLTCNDRINLLTDLLFYKVFSNIYLFIGFMGYCQYEEEY